MDWKDVEVGDIISVKIKSRVNPHILTAKVTNIIHYNRATDTNLDPLMYYISDNYYLIHLQTICQDPQQSKEYAITSYFWNLINIQKKGGTTTTMPLEIGKQYKVNIPQDWQIPGVQEFTGRLVEIKPQNALTHLVYSKELEENKKGHTGEGYTEQYGCWFCKPEWLTPLESEPTKETIKLEDIFNE